MGVTGGREGVRIAPPLTRGWKHSANPAGMILLQGVAAELSKKGVVWIGEQEHPAEDVAANGRQVTGAGN